MFFANAAMADHSCLPEFNSLQILETFNIDSTADFTYPLKSENASGIFISKVRLTVSLDGFSHEMKLRAHFDEAFQGVSLPYNLYSILVLQNGAVIGWYDFTRECHGPGVGFFPGQFFSPPAIKLSGEGKQSFQIMVWGRL